MDEERANLEETYAFLKREIEKEAGALSRKRSDMSVNNREMFVEAASRKMVDVVPYLDTLLNSAVMAHVSDERIRKYERMLVTPYFARVDFIEEDYDKERIHIGYHNLMDDKTVRVYVYDWRAPVSSVYYRFGTGAVFYDSPDGRVNGEVTLKRQYKIENGELIFYADVSVALRDEMLLLALSKGATDKMRDIVETIQREQDEAIRDETSRALIVSGVAGSGKTSVALHRAAYLMYERGTANNIKHGEIVIVSPNRVFSEYIDEVLPGLGEENADTADFEKILTTVAGKTALNVQPRHTALENAAKDKSPGTRKARDKAAKWLKSSKFAKILRAYAAGYEKKFRFRDVTVDGRAIFTKDELKASFENNVKGLSAQAKLNRVMKAVYDRAEPLFAKVREKLKEKINDDERYRLEEEETLERAMKQYIERFDHRVRSMFVVDAESVYLRLFSAKNSPVPGPIARAVTRAATKETGRNLPFDALAGLAYFKILITGSGAGVGTTAASAKAKHVIVDEGQDYGALHYILLSKLYPDAKFTVLGDLNQTFGQSDPLALKKAAAVLGKGLRDAKFLHLNRSYRSSREITAFAEGVLGRVTADEDVVAREGDAVTSAAFNSRAEMDEAVAAEAIKELSRFEQVAVVTRTYAAAQRVARFIEGANLIYNTGRVKKGVNVLPVYAAKGLEFDAVLVYDAGKGGYGADDKNALYVACTRALHKLSLFAVESLGENAPNV